MSILLVVLAACSRRSEGNDTSPRRGAAAEVRLGYFPNVTHAPALIGVGKGMFAQELGKTKLATQVFNAGPDEINALLGGSLDMAFIGPGPTINGFARSQGALRLVSGAVSGGAQLVVRPEITLPADLKGKTVATPQLGNTQDVALKTWLVNRGLSAGSGPDQVTITNTENAQTLDLFRKGQLDGAWVPEPWSSRLVLDAGAKVLVDEKSLWPQGQFPSTVLIVRTQFLLEHSETVQAVLRGELAAINWANGNKDEAKTLVNNELQKLTGKGLGQPVLDRAFQNIEMTHDPLAKLFPQLADNAVTAGVAKPTNLHDLASFTLLNQELQARDQPTVDPAGIGEK